MKKTFIFDLQRHAGPDIRALQQKHAELCDKQQSIIDKAAAETRGMTDDEQKEFDSLQSQIDGLANTIKTYQAVEDRKKTLDGPDGKLFRPSTDPAAPAVLSKGIKEDLEPGIRLARYVKATLISQKESRAFEDVASKMYPKDEILQQSKSAMGTNTPSDGGVLVPEDFSTEIIPLLREQSSIRSLGIRSVPMPSGNLKMPRQTGAANFMWVGENKPIISSKPALGMLNLAAKKLAGMIPFSNELLQSSSISADQFVRDELVNGIAESEDITAIYGKGTDDEPIGIINVKGIDTANVGALPDSDTLGLIVGAVMGKKFPNKRNFGWIFNGALWSRYYNLKDAAGNYIHRAEMDKGLLLGFPFRMNNNIEVGIDEHGLTDIIFGDFSQFIVGETLGLQIALSQEATYWDGSTMVSAFANDQTVMRALMREDFGVRYKEAFVVRRKVYTK